MGIKEEMDKKLQVLSKEFDDDQKELFVECIFDYMLNMSNTCIKKKKKYRFIDENTESIEKENVKIKLNSLKNIIICDLKIHNVLKKYEIQEKELKESESILREKKKEIETKEKEIRNKDIKKLENSRRLLGYIGETAEQITIGDNKEKTQDSIINTVEKIFNDMKENDLLPLDYKVPTFKKVSKKKKKLTSTKNKEINDSENQKNKDENSNIDNVNRSQEENKDIKEVFLDKSESSNNEEILNEKEIDKSNDSSKDENQKEDTNIAESDKNINEYEVNQKETKNKDMSKEVDLGKIENKEDESKTNDLDSNEQLTFDKNEGDIN